MSPRQAFALLILLKKHLHTESFDFFTTKRFSFPEDKFEKLRERFRFEKMIKEYSDTEIRDFFIANLLYDKHWSIFDEHSKSRYGKWLAKKNGRSYHFRNEVEALMYRAIKQGLKYHEAFRDKDGQCLALNMYLGGELSIDTFCILDKLHPFVGKLCTDDFRKSLCMVAIKYSPFVKVDIQKFETIEKEIYADKYGCT